MKKLKVNPMGVISTLLLWVCMSTGANGSGDRWSEEVLLHDGQKVIVERYVQRGGRHEIGQKGAFVDQRLNFTVPGGGQRIEWKDTFSQDLGSASFLPMLLDIADGTPYLVAYPMGCLAYNKWGRPNPPYVIFKHASDTWQRIPLESLPQELKTPNLIFSDPDITVEKMGKRMVSAETIQRIVGETKQEEFKNILREPLTKDRIVEMCGNRVLYKGHWIVPNSPTARALVDAQQK